MRLFFLLLMLAAAGIVILTLARTPRADRNWEAALARAPQFTPQVTDQGGAWALDHLRAFEFDATGATTKNWRPASIDPAALTEIWFFIEPFGRWDGVAHSFLSFVFAGGNPQTISVSVEARREEGEDYSAIRGAFNAYELIYLWSTEKDILTRIGVYLDHDLYAYRLDVTPEQARAILDHFITRTNRLSERPRFYNTLTSNCTNELAKAVNDAFPGALPWHLSHVLTGRSAERLHALEFVEGGADFEAIKARAEIGAVVRTLDGAGDDAFSEQWRAHVQAGSVQTPKP